MTTAFKCFSKELFQFLEELADNNNRDWFNDNKNRYLNDVVEPVLDFIEAVGDELGNISPHFTADTRRNGGSMFRIYRDARFSKDKRPYKENVGCHFRHKLGKSAHAPGFYLHLQPGNTFIGAGIWKPVGETLSGIRDAITEQPESWHKIVNDKNFIQRFGQVEGERLKRPPRGYDADHPCIDDLKLKSFFVKQPMDDKQAMSPAFFKEVMTVYEEAAPLMKFISQSIEMPF